MRLRFSPFDDEAAFSAVRNTLLDSTGLLDEFTQADIEEFLLQWCPRKLSVPAEESERVCGAVAAYVEFMADIQRLVGRVGHRSWMANRG